MIVNANALHIPLKDKSVQCVVTSPPYWGLRDYGVSDQLGLEPTPEEYVANMVAVFREVWRVLRDDGTLWLNLGDSYANARSYQVPDGKWKDVGNSKPSTIPQGLKQKDLVGIPWRVAFALQADGWYLRNDIIWHKPNPMPESVQDRCTKSHEYIFLLTKNAKYYYDNEAIKEEKAESSINRMNYEKWGENNKGREVYKESHTDFTEAEKSSTKRNKRTVWTVTTKPYKGAHYATFPPELPEICIKAGTKEGDIVLDPFVGSGTTCMVARNLGRQSVGLDLSFDYLYNNARKRLELDKLAEWGNGIKAEGNYQELPMFGGK
jgi:DNA modification methylase